MRFPEMILKIFQEQYKLMVEAYLNQQHYTKIKNGYKYYRIKLTGNNK